MKTSKSKNKKRKSYDMEENKVKNVINIRTKEN